MKNLQILLALTIANLKMFIRDKSALFWSLFFPFLIIGIFGVFDFAKMANNTIGLVYTDETKIYAETLKGIFEEEGSYKFHTNDIDTELDALENDDRLIVLEFTTNPDAAHDAASDQAKITVNTYVSKENEQAGEIVTLVAEKILSDISLQMQHIELPFEVERNVVNTNNLRFIDFMVPGVIALSIMQGALFGVVGAIVVSREKGILRRVFATPLSKSTYLISHIISRTIISLFQIAILLIFSFVVFEIRIVGSLALVAGMAILGSLTFMAMGIFFSSFAKSEEAARAMVMPVQMLFMFTGGVYFDRSVLPDWLYNITAYLPFTYLADALREIMVKGYSLVDRSVQIATLGILAWMVVLVIVSVKTFTWERK